MPQPIPEPAFALWLLAQAQRHDTVLAILRSASRLARISALAQAMAIGVEVLSPPSCDVLPYDRVPPSASAIGRRVRTLVALTQPPARPRLLLTSAAAALIRVRPSRGWHGATLALRPGDTLSLDTLRLQLAERGYHWDEHVDEPGEVALRGHAIDLFPAGENLPSRLDLDDAHRVVAIQTFDPLTQRTIAPADQVVLTPAIEYALDPDDLDAAAAALDARAWTDPDFAPADLAPENLQIPAPAQRLVPLTDYMPGVAWWADPEVPDRWAAAAEAIQDAHAAASTARRAAPDTPLPPRPSRLYITPSQATAALTGPALAIETSADNLGEALAAPARIADLVGVAQSALAKSLAVVIATPAEPERVAASLARRGLDARIAVDWADATAGGAAVLHMEAAEGLRTPEFVLLPIGALLRAHTPDHAPAPDTDAPRCGDVVVHAEHGVACLKSLRAIETDGIAEERIALGFADNAELLIPVGELDCIWRYGSSQGRVALDRLGGDAWQRKRVETQAEIDIAAARLATAAAARADVSAPVITPPAASYAALARRFPHPPTRCQKTATDAVLADLASGRPMDRLLCGDVGFGKTEVALRAAAAAALAGWQVLIAAPTTVLARQHLDTVRARFAGSGGIEVEGLVRGANTLEGRATRRRLRNGATRIVVGTQSLASEGVRFAKLGLAIIDEEQRFGEADKARLNAPHKLVMTATPIPRTLQGALVRLREISTMVTAPARRQATRTFVLPWEPSLVRDALLRERRRGGQSFIVVPRIQDLVALQSELAELIPGMELVMAHGRMAPDTLERAVLGFARGEGDVLLTTNIIEAGLDIPRANLMVVVGADRFGLAQLHQLRGRVGRGARRGTAYLLTPAGRRLPPATQRRLHAMEALSGLGAGAAIAASDLDLRGAGDLFGEAQAGHVRALGTGLYQHLLSIAVAKQQGQPTPPTPPDLRTGLTGCIPEAYVPEQDLRLSLYSHLTRLALPEELLAFTDELEDRFGPRPSELDGLIALQRLRMACVRRGVVRLEAGPRGAALTLANANELDQLAAACGGTVRDGRMLLTIAAASPMARVERLLTLLG